MSSVQALIKQITICKKKKKKKTVAHLSHKKNEKPTWIFSPKQLSSGTVPQLDKAWKCYCCDSVTLQDWLVWHLGPKPFTYMCSLPEHMVSNLLSCCHQGWLVPLVQGGSPFPGSIRSPVFVRCCTDVAILPHIFQVALLVRYSTKTFFYHLEFPSASLTLYFRGQLCFALLRCY